MTTGISAYDRSVTCGLLADNQAQALDLIRPGHVVPLIAKAGGVRERRGHTEAGWELARLAGITPEVGVLAELVVDGDADESQTGYVGAGMMRAPDCVEFGRKWGIRCCTIEDLVEYVEEKEGPLNLKSN